jgi:hypothetical protein
MLALSFSGFDPSQTLAIWLSAVQHWPHGWGTVVQSSENQVQEQFKVDAWN